MSTKTDFTLEEWETIRNAPYLAAAAVMVAGRSGIIGSIKEAFVTAQTFYESASSESPLIKALSAQDEVKLSQEFVSNQVSFREAAQAPEKLRSLAVEKCHAAVGLLNQKGGPGEAESYKRWVMDIAEKVANAAKEGAFFGLGGERVSDDEKVVLTDLAAALQVAAATDSVSAPRGA
jgi:hypothetical protein